MSALRRPSLPQRLSRWAQRRRATGAPAALDWRALQRLVDANDLDGLVAALRRIDDDPQRHALADGWRAADKQHRARRRAVEEGRVGSWTAHERRGQLLAVAAAGLLPEAELASVLARQRWFPLAEGLRRGRRESPDGFHNRRCAAVLDVLAPRGVVRLPALAGRLAAKLGERDQGTDSYRLVDRMLRTAGAPPPDAEPFARLWMEHLWTDVRGELGRGPEWVRLFVSSLGLPGLGWTVSGLERHVVELVGDGTLPRADVLDVLVGRMHLPERPGDLAHVTDLYERLAPTTDEVAARAADLLAVLGAAPARACRLAVRQLREGVAHGALDPRVAVDAAGAVLTRGEKALVLDQLRWLEGTARTTDDPGLLDDLVDVTTLAFTHPASDVQRRAAALVARRLGDVSPQVADAVRAAAANLPSDLRPRLAAPSVDVRAVPAAPEPARPQPVTAIETLAELAEELSAIEHAVDAMRLVDGVRLERVLAGLVTHAGGDRAALAAALAPALPSDDHWRSAMAELIDRTGGCGGRGTWFVWQALLGSVTHGTREVRRRRGRQAGTGSRDLRDAWPLKAEGPPAWAVARRLEDLAIQFRSPAPVAWVSTPTTTDGALDPDVLVDRLVTVAAGGRAPGTHDLAAALARCPRGPHPDAADRLRSAAPGLAWVGDVADRLAAPPPPPGPAPSVPPVMTDPHAGGQLAVGAWWLDAYALCLPHDPDLAASHLVVPLTVAAAGEEGARVLLRLAEAPGRPGPGVAAAVVAVLTHERAGYRVAALDALVALAARDPKAQDAVWPAIGTGLVRSGAPVTRFAGTLADTARAGGVAPAWTAAAAAMRHALSAAKPPNRFETLLAAAVEIAQAAQAAGTLPADAAAQIPGLDELAARKGSSRTLAEARRLRQALHP